MSHADLLEVAVLTDPRSVLGEGPVWHAEKQVLYWVDIKGNKLHVFNPATKQNRTISTPKFIGCVAPRKSGGLIAGLFDGFYTLDFDKENWELIADPEKNPENRFNDGKVDPRGRLFAGTMEDLQTKPAQGNMWRLDTNSKTPVKVFDGVGISNGLAWSSDHKTFYYVDTPLQRIDAFDYDIETGNLSNRRTVIKLQESGLDGYPDGMCIDAEDCLWLAHWEGSKVTRWNPKTAQLLRTVQLPVSKVTCPAFGGPNLDQLYITTASIRSDTVKEPLAGALFVLRNPGTHGVAGIQYDG